MNSATRASNDFKRRRNARCVSYIIGGVIFQIFIILVFLYVILRVRNIKLFLHSPKVENNVTSAPSSSMMLLHTQVTIKNSNFGHYKFKNSTVVLAYRGKHVGEAGLGNGSAKARSKKMINVVVAVSLKSWTGDGGLRKIRLTAIAQLAGKVHILKVIRRRKVVKMNCTMDVDIKTQAIVNLHCK